MEHVPGQLGHQVGPAADDIQVIAPARDHNWGNWGDLAKLPRDAAGAILPPGAVAEGAVVAREDGDTDGALER